VDQHILETLIVKSLAAKRASGNIRGQWAQRWFRQL